MVALAVLFAMVAALCVGYYFGRRAGTTAPTWQQRTSRAAMGKLALSLVALVIARRVHRGLVNQHTRRPVATLWGDLARVRSR